MRFINGAVIRILVIVAFNLCILVMVTMAYSHRGASAEVISQAGSRGREVIQIQQRLHELGYEPGKADGHYSGATADAVRAFQMDQGIPTDGIAGPDTLRALGISGGQAAGGLLSGVYRQGDSGDGIRQIQEALARLGYYTGSPDGIYGSGTALAVQTFQQAHSLYPDGVTGSATLRALGLSSPSAGGSLSDSDYQLLSRLVSAEAGDEPYSGQVAVAAVILNRVEHPSFPDTISAVAYQPGAFAAMTDGQVPQPVSESALRAAKDALNGADPSGGAVYYFNPDKSGNKWIRSRPVIKTIGSHIFCA